MRDRSQRHVNQKPQRQLWTVTQVHTVVGMLGEGAIPMTPALYIVTAATWHGYAGHFLAAAHTSLAWRWQVPAKSQRYDARYPLPWFQSVSRALTSVITLSQSSNKTVGHKSVSANSERVRYIISRNSG
jgi:hypothetical protein